MVEPRLANARRHVELDPCSYRLPDARAVRRHFEQVLSNSAAPTTTILVAGAVGKVAGMAEMVPLPDLPDHQILIPPSAAHIHTVVLENQRGTGIGTALVAAAEQQAAERGVTLLIAASPRATVTRSASTPRPATVRTESR
jgi:GNAT superfamily N-acetyltransferase